MLTLMYRLSEYSVDLDFPRFRCRSAFCSIGGVNRTEASPEQRLHNLNNKNSEDTEVYYTDGTELMNES